MSKQPIYAVIFSVVVTGLTAALAWEMSAPLAEWIIRVQQGE